MRVVVAGLAARYPLGGVAWDYLQYAAGLRSLGHEVFYLEDTGEYCYDPLAQTFTPDATRNAAHLERTCTRFGIPPGAWCLRNWDGACHGVPLERLREVMRDADVLLNVSGTLWLRDEYRALRCKKVFIDSDPGYNQTWIALGSAPGAEGKLADAAARILSHDAHFTFGENVHGADGAMPPTPGVRWRATRQPLCLDLLRPQPADAVRDRRFTTVMSWKAHTWELEWGGRRYGGKAASFAPYLGLAERVGPRFELAVGGKAPVAELRARGFAIADPEAASGDADRYLAYLAGSYGEWSVAKEVYTAMRTGWFSCRTAVYLALGRPAVVEDTGWRPYYDVGRGLFAFSSPEEAAEGIARIDADHPAACRAAREVAEEAFDARKVLPPLLE